MLASCKKDSLLNQTPPTQLTDASYWTTVSDLELYMNSLYGIFNHYGGFGTLGIYSTDGNSDNMVTQSYDTRLNGENTVVSNGGYADWTDIRSVNYFLVNYNRVKESWTNISPYVGEAHFFRAWLYYQGVVSFGALPWENQPLNINDSALIYAPRQPRNIVMDSIVADLDSAIADLPVKASAQAMRLYKEFAEGFKARVCLYEGTWEKYHAGDVFGIPGSTGTDFLQLAASAADLTIASGTFALDNVNVYNGYFNLFNQTDYTSSKEIMFWAAFDQPSGNINDWQNYYQFGSGGSESIGISQSLVDDYLCTDGKPISSSSLYEGDDSLAHIVANRDPRLRQILFMYGDTVVTDVPDGPDQIFTYPALLNGTPCTTGFQIKKGLNTDWNQNPHNSAGGTDGVIYMRYAEVLLIDAEAKAELGTIAQGDLDGTINKLRDRVGMPHLQLASIPSDPNWEFPQLSPILNEVRRERHVELACEGFRLDDICRWAAAPTLIVGKQPLGTKLNQFLTVIPGIVPGTNIYVNPQDYIEPYQKVQSMPTGYNFNINRDYLLPIDLQDVTLNKNIQQNPGW
jgi:hypothetical protein